MCDRCNGVTRGGGAASDFFSDCREKSTRRQAISVFCRCMRRRGDVFVHHATQIEIPTREVYRRIKDMGGTMRVIPMGEQRGEKMVPKKIIPDRSSYQKRREIILPVDLREFIGWNLC